MMRFKISAWHNGEHGSVFHVIDLAGDETGQPTIVSSFSTRKLAERAHDEAIRCRDKLNREKVFVLLILRTNQWGIPVDSEVSGTYGQGATWKVYWLKRWRVIPHECAVISHSRYVSVS